MGMEIPGVVPTGIHSDLKTVENRPAKIAEREGNAGKYTPPPLKSGDISRAVEQLEKMVTQFNRRFEISVNESINRIVVKVIDTESDKVIKEIPPEEIQHLLLRLQEMMGLLVDEKI
jgi:flagellar protein FlaG